VREQTKIKTGLGVQRWYWTSEALGGNRQLGNGKRTPYVRVKNKYLKVYVERYKTGKNILGK
jgi:hypothetical protein